jgi:hypothetical protein
MNPDRKTPETDVVGGGLRMQTRSILTRVGKFLAKPQVNIVVALLLLYAGICELGETVIEKMFGLELKAAHGLMLFAVKQVFISLTDILEGLEDLAIVAEAKEVNDELGEVNKQHEARGIKQPIS